MRMPRDGNECVREKRGGSFGRKGAFDAFGDDDQNAEQPPVERGDFFHVAFSLAQREFGGVGMIFLVAEMLVEERRFSGMRERDGARGWCFPGFD